MYLTVHETWTMFDDQTITLQNLLFPSFYLHVGNPLQGLNSGHHDFIASACIQQTILPTQCNAPASVDNVLLESWSCVFLGNF